MALRIFRKNHATFDSVLLPDPWPSSRLNQPQKTFPQTIKFLTRIKADRENAFLFTAAVDSN